MKVMKGFFVLSNLGSTLDFYVTLRTLPAKALK